MLTKTDLLKRYNMDEETAEYIVQEADGLDITINDITIRSTGQSNSKGDLIEEVVYNKNKHICYI